MAAVAPAPIEARNPGATTDRAISQAQAMLRANPTDWQAADRLAAAYLQKVREVGDPSYYPKAEALLGTVLASRPAELEPLVLMGAVSLSRHQFQAALELGRKARAVDAYAARPLGIIADAEIELGRYADARSTVQQMVDLRPDLSSYARVSYLRELYGDVDGAVQSMQMAVEAGGPVPENDAYTRVLLGNLLFSGGRLKEADEQYRQALTVFPDYVAGLAGVAQVRAARGQLAGAAALYRHAVDIYPVPQYVVALGDVYQAMGDAKRAAETYELAAAEHQLYRANGVDVDAELALFLADQQRDLSTARDAARRAFQARPSVVTADVLAWSLYQSGDLTQALAASRQAHRLGTQNALFYFHSGMIEARLGMTAEASADLSRAIAINPFFSVRWVPVARDALAVLGAPVR